MTDVLEASRPMARNPLTAHRASTRLSTYSTAPTLTPSIAPSHLSTKSHHSATSYTSEASMTPSERASPLVADIRTLATGLARLDDHRLQNQRYVASENKKEEIGMLALGAKLERALGRRMSSQDAVFTKRKTMQGEKIAVRAV